jgi:hypothetical protein
MGQGLFVIDTAPRSRMSNHPPQNSHFQKCSASVMAVTGHLADDFPACGFPISHQSILSKSKMKYRIKK